MRTLISCRSSRTVVIPFRTPVAFRGIPAVLPVACCLLVLAFLCLSFAAGSTSSYRTDLAAIPSHETQSAPQAQAVKLGYPTDGRLYHGVHPADGKGDEAAYIEKPEVLRDYLNAAFTKDDPRRGVAWVYFSHEWEEASGRGFPWDAVKRIDEVEKSVPFIRLMLRTTYDATKKKEEVFTFDKILNDGDINAALEEWGKKAAKYGKPLVVEYGTEVNSETFPWNGAYNGANQTAADKFKAAYRHVVEVIEGAGAKNITWVFHVTAADKGTPEWNRISSYYPGPDVVDWIGISVYGPQSKGEECVSFEKVMEDVMKDPHGVRSLEGGKSLFILETGVVKDYPQKTPSDAQCEHGLWAEEALAALTQNPWEMKVRGFSWWNEGWDTKEGYVEMRVQKSKRLRQTFQYKLMSGRFVHSPIYEQ